MSQNSFIIGKLYKVNELLHVFPPQVLRRPEGTYVNHAWELLPADERDSVVVCWKDLAVMLIDQYAADGFSVGLLGDITVVVHHSWLLEL